MATSPSCTVRIAIATGWSRNSSAGEYRFAIRGLSVLSTVIIRDLLAYLNLIHSPHDNISLTRVLLAPRWNFPEELALEVRVEADRRRCSLYDVLTTFSRGGSRTGPTADPLEATNWGALKQLLHDLHWAAQNVTVTSLFSLLCERLQILSFLDERDLRYVNAFAEFLREWEEKIAKFPALAALSGKRNTRGRNPPRTCMNFSSISSITSRREERLRRLSLKTAPARSR